MRGIVSMSIRLALIAAAALALQSTRLAAQPERVEDKRPSFAEWLSAVRAEALARGIRQEVVDQALGNLEEPLPVVLERDRSQAETILSLEQYLSRRVTATVTAAGREMIARHRALLADITERYGVPPSVIVAIWGLESNYGRFSGIRPTVPALATLAWDPRRSTFFRQELFSALEILNRGDIDIGRMRGSWAGAMGQVQFMPSSYLKWAEDYDGDGLRDIWSSTADVFASIANYLKGHGWVTGERWGREVTMTADVARQIAGGVPRRNGTCQATRDMTVAMPVARWTEFGVELATHRALPASDFDVALVSGVSRRFLVGVNYDALLDYNCAHSYAVSVGLLADALDAPSKPSAGTARRKASAKAGRQSGAKP
jgi:membrane-bound lytic murein transglycosylase B